MVDDETAALRAQWLDELTKDKSESDETTMIVEWQSEARRLKRRRSSRFPSMDRHPAPRRRGAAWVDEITFLDAITEQIGDPAVPPELVRRVSDMWFVMCNGRLEVARSWWTAGISPFNDIVLELKQHGVRPEDLALQWTGKSLLQHLLTDGMAPRECAEAALLLRLHDAGRDPA